MNAGVGFGEIALIYNEKRTATIKKNCKTLMKKYMHNNEIMTAKH